MKKYSNDEVTIVWKPELCTHASRCWKGLPEVFKPKEKPWIVPEGSDSEAIINQVKQCPSGALSYELIKNNMSDLNIEFNKEKSRFEAKVEGHIALIDTLLAKGNVMFLTHTEVPKELGGRGIGKELVQFALNYIKEHNYTLAPLCPFVAAYVKKNSEWKEILAPGYNVG